MLEQLVFKILSQFCTSSVSEMFTFHNVYSKKVDNGRVVQLSYTGVIYRQISNSTKMHLCALIVSEILTFQCIYLQKVGQGHRVQFLKFLNSAHSVANVKIEKSRWVYSAQDLAVAKISAFQMFTFKE